jgi:hypothetical protein
MEQPQIDRKSGPDPRWGVGVLWTGAVLLGGSQHNLCCCEAKDRHPRQEAACGAAFFLLGLTSADAEQHRTPVEFELGTAIEAISKAWTLIGAGATGVYIYDDEMDQTYWPHEFSALGTVSMSESVRTGQGRGV